MTKSNDWTKMKCKTEVTIIFGRQKSRIWNIEQIKCEHTGQKWNVKSRLQSVLIGKTQRYEYWPNNERTKINKEKIYVSINSKTDEKYKTEL